MCVCVCLPFSFHFCFHTFSDKFVVCVAFCFVWLQCTNTHHLLFTFFYFKNKPKTLKQKNKKKTKLNNKINTKKNNYKKNEKKKTKETKIKQNKNLKKTKK